LLAHVFLDKFSQQQGRTLRGFTPDAMAAIEGYPWHGNVREMENVIKRAVIMAEGAQITASDLGLAESQQAEAEPINLRQVREDAERKAIIRVMSRVNGNIAQAAEMLGVSRPTLYDLISKYGLKS
jgi:two-component system NtrC family response regulator